VQMPLMTGTEVADCIRSESHNPNHRTPMVALTAHIQAGHFNQILAHGFACCKTKPISKNELIELVAGQALQDRPGSGENGPRHADHSAIWDREAALVVTGGDASVALDMLDLLVRRLAEQCGQLRVLIEESNYKEAAKHVHKLHGSAQFCASRQLASAARELESALLAEQAKKLPQCMLALDQAAQALLAEYKLLSSQT